MLGKTHMVVGIASTLAITQPKTIPEIVLATGVGVIGSLISDVDIDTSESHRSANKITLLTIGVVLLVLALDYFGDFGIIQRIMKNSGITRIIAGILIFVGTCAFGKEQPHRSFMHSILALIILNFSLGLIFPKIIPYFTIGFLSHLFIDSLNYKKVQIWYPLKRSVRFKLCHANGIVNTVLFIVGFIVSVFEIVSLTFHSIV